MTDPRLHHLDACLREAVLDLDAQFARHLGGVADERAFTFRVGVVGVARGEIAKGRLTLNVNVVLVVVDLEHRFGRVDDAPDDDRADLDRVAAVVVDL